ncbi:MAG: flavodoxin [Clostridia bacterium]|nr:flavodoxin [Clostridia bacterium]
MEKAIRYFTKSKKGNTKKLAAAAEKALNLTAETVDVPLEEKTDVVVLINAMYAATVDKEVKNFIAQNKDKIGVIVNVNSSATGKSTLPAVKKVADSVGVKVSDKEFHCKGSWIFLNKGKPDENDLIELQVFLKKL